MAKAAAAKRRSSDCLKVKASGEKTKVQDGKVLAERSIEGPEAPMPHAASCCLRGQPSHPGTFKDLRLYKFEEDYWLSSLVCSFAVVGCKRPQQIRASKFLTEV